MQSRGSERRTRQHASALFSPGKLINLRRARRLCLLFFQADLERVLLGRDRNLVFGRQSPNRLVEGGFLPFYRFLRLAEGPLAPRVERIPGRSGGPADFCFHCDSFSFAQSSPRGYTLHLRPNEAGEVELVDLCSQDENCIKLRGVSQAQSKRHLFGSRSPPTECGACGHPISRVRLNAVPWARHCRECKARERSTAA